MKLTINLKTNCIFNQVVYSSDQVIRAMRQFHEHTKSILKEDNRQLTRNALCNMWHFILTLIQVGSCNTNRLKYKTDFR